uniref:Rab-GAP TBC domain-containing protein n=1 Tax=Leersia perrieri TaxID=77586 RepID=A0A0D9XFX3_9ORYZ
MKALRRSSTSSSPSSSSSSPTAASSPPSSSWIHLRSLLVAAASSSSSSSSSAAAASAGSSVALVSASAAAASSSSSPAPAPSSPHSDRGGIKSPWSRRKRKRALSRQQWESLFSANGKLRDGGKKFLKKVRSGGIEPGIRAEIVGLCLICSVYLQTKRLILSVLLCSYELNSSEEERNTIKIKKRKEYEKLRRQCQQILNCYKGNGLKVINENNDECTGLGCSTEGSESPCFEDVNVARASVSLEELKPENSEPEQPDNSMCTVIECMEEDTCEFNFIDPCIPESESSDSESSDEDDPGRISLSGEENCDPDPKFTRTTSFKADFFKSSKTSEDFSTWQRIIRLDAIRANTEWILFSRNQAEISKETALQCAVSVGLRDYDHLDPCMIYHAARLVGLLEAYAVYDPEIGYCQGMSDLLSPIIAVMEEDDEAFWCFVGFMRKARHNFRLDEVGIRSQLKIVSQIIKRKDSHLYKHLQKLQAEDCFFVYRMVVVLFRRELTFEQTVCLWEVMWADQAAIRAGIGRSTWAKIRLRAPPTDDLLLYAIAACVLQRRKLIIEKYSSMDEILRECNSMAGQLDVWRLLDDAHDLVVNFHDKI